MEQTLISRFCSIEGSHCEREISYQGNGTYFFAYPSSSHWKDFSGQLREELAGRGVKVCRWEDIVQGELIFCKVCNGIYSHDMLLAEVTEANANVLLETGYAIAVGRLPILLIDENRKKWDRKLLSTLESCYYTNREEIYDHLTKLQAEYKIDSERPGLRLPMFESTGIFDREETPGTIYHLKPKIITDQIRRIDRVLKTSVFKPTYMDPNDSVYDEFIPQARKIHEAQLLVASFVSTAHTTYYNAEVNSPSRISFYFSLTSGGQTQPLSYLAPNLAVRYGLTSQWKVPSYFMRVWPGGQGHHVVHAGSPIHTRVPKVRTASPCPPDV